MHNFYSNDKMKLKTDHNCFLSLSARRDARNLLTLRSEMHDTRARRLTTCISRDSKQ
jgi:hypothetical protein